MENSTLIVQRNGRRVDTVAAVDRGLSFGDGLFETIRVHYGQAPLLGRHWQRLQSGCERLGIPFDGQALNDEVFEVLADLSAFPAVSLKVILTRGEGGSGYAVSNHCEPTRLVIARHIPSRPSAWWTDGIEAWQCETRLARNPRLAGMKHLNRLENVLARLEWNDPNVAEGVLRNFDGEYVEATASNLFLVIEGCLLTPDLSDCGVAGVIRQLLIDGWFDSVSLPVHTGTVRDEELEAAQEVFLTNAVIGAWPVRRCGRLRWQVGPVCQLIQNKLASIFGELWCGL